MHAMKMHHTRALEDALDSDVASGDTVGWPALQGSTFRSIDLLHSCLAKPSDGSVMYQNGEYTQPPKGFLQLKQALLSS